VVYDIYHTFYENTRGLERKTARFTFINKFSQVTGRSWDLRLSADRVQSVDHEKFGDFVGGAGAPASAEAGGGMRPCSAKRWRTLSRTPGLYEAMHRQGDGEFDDRLQLAVLAALHGFEAMKFEAHDAVDDRHLAQPVAEIRGHSRASSLKGEARPVIGLPALFVIPAKAPGCPGKRNRL
jgi:hypothetical protein